MREVDKVTKVGVKVYMKRKFDLKTLMVEHSLSIQRHCTDILSYVTSYLPLLITHDIECGMGWLKRKKTGNMRPAGWERIQGWWGEDTSNMLRRLTGTHRQ